MSHSPHGEEMDSRLRRLESANRRLVAGTMGLALALAAIVSCGLMNSTSGLPDDLEVVSLTARTIRLGDSLVVVGGDGRTLVSIAGSGITVGQPTSWHTRISEGSLTLRAGNAGYRAILLPHTLILADEAGPRMGLSAGDPPTTSASSLQFLDELQRVRMSVLCQASYGAQIAFTDASGAITSLIGKPGVALERAQFTDATGDFAGAGRSILSSERGLFDAVRLLND